MQFKIVHDLVCHPIYERFSLCQFIATQILNLTLVMRCNWKTFWCKIINCNAKHHVVYLKITSKEIIGVQKNCSEHHKYHYHLPNPQAVDYMNYFIRTTTCLKKKHGTKSSTITWTRIVRLQYFWYTYYSDHTRSSNGSFMIHAAPI